MAKLNGVEIKNLKSFVGHEGVCYQGDVWLNGKKLGFWSQDSWGAICDNFSFDETLLDKACKDFQDGFPDSYEYKEFCADKETFLHNLVTLKEIEKDCKKDFKKGYKATIYLTDGFHHTWTSLPDDGEDADLLKKYSKQVSEMKSGLFKGKDFKPVIFRPNQFNVTVNKNNPALEIFM